MPGMIISEETQTPSDISSNIMGIKQVFIIKIQYKNV
jgi:hypothetical protein